MWVPGTLAGASAPQSPGLQGPSQACRSFSGAQDLQGALGQRLLQPLTVIQEQALAGVT